MKYHALLAGLLVGTAVASTAMAQEKLGTYNNPIKFALIPSQDAKEMMAKADPLQKCLEKESGLFYEISIPPSYIVVVEGFGSKKVDLSLFTASGYALALEKGYKVEPILKVIRKGSDTYKGMIVVHADSNIKTLKDLNGKKFAFVDPISGSGRLAPKLLLNKEKVVLGEEVFAGKHDVSLTMVYKKQVDAAAAFYSEPTDKDNKKCDKIDGKTCFANDARRLLLKGFEDAVEKLRILALTEDLPNDPVVIRSDLPADIKTKIKTAMQTCLAKVPKETGVKINEIDGATDATENDYKPLVNLYKELKIDLNSAVK